MPTKKQLEQQLKENKFQADRKIQKLSHQLSEAAQLGFTSPPYDLINPWSQLYDGQQLIFPIFPSISSPYLWFTESYLDLLRAYASWMYATNTFAQGILKGLKNFVIKSGFTYEVQPARDLETDKGLVKQAQKIIDDFCSKNKWHIKQGELFIRSRRDGEYFIEFFPQEDGCTAIRVINPWTVRSPDGSEDWTFGIKTDPEDYESVEAYHITNRQLSAGRIVPADEILHYRINVDMGGSKRGVSDFFSTQETLANVQKLLRAETLGESVRCSIAYVREFAQASSDTVLSMQAANTDYTIPEATFTGTPRLQPVQKIEPGSVHDVPQGLQMKPPPASQTAQGIAILDSALQSLAQYWQVPSWMVTGDASSGSYASSLTEESPFSRMCECEQGYYSAEFKAVMFKVLSIAVAQELLPEDALTRLDVQVIAPSVVTRQTDKMTQRHAQLHQSQVMSKRTWTHLEGLDFDHEKENMIRDHDTFDAVIDKASEHDDSKPRETDVTRE